MRPKPATATLRPANLMGPQRCTKQDINERQTHLLASIRDAERELDGLSSAELVNLSFDTDRAIGRALTGIRGAVVQVKGRSRP